MKKAASFEEVLEAADKLSLEEQGEIVHILNKRMIEQRRKEIISEVHEARREYKDGLCHPATSEEIIKDILS